MSEAESTTKSAQDPNGQNGEATNGEQPSAATEPQAPPTPTAEQRLADALAEAARTRDQLLRTAADFDNFRKRSRREVDDAQRRGRESTVKELLPVFDNFERALQHAEGSADAKAVAEGLRMVLKQFLDTLEKMGIQRVVAVGQPFDPAQHEAIQHLESPEHPAGVVLYEVQPGYRMGDYLVRPAMVVVSKGPPGGGAAAAS
ncbi:nucleotide exchange factor GrpE [Polyangium sp. y55x31]|uniref:nucleotide exchange factor GrpE n=1 Tax=Polyangium sp. y55x31 TaxID=3042688 RepID=UPI0024823A45|nr:nucleotide exchange factor GrpE [Polyangium sp. y55x31]MDI1479901.1 nucleotide exchange factor GrpE [Polyangium sp. y55x31]